ncbi:MAG: two-component regulator propeller domain-containing protein [Flavobacteriales bacterium]|nr:two-component regulator propeller domain-containing protein [Flavobacteriales bacterium]
MRKIKIPYLIFIVVTLLVIKSGIGQQYSFIPFSVEEGLSQTQVFDICSDDQGDIWFGTAGGASCFDGKHFTNYSTENGLNDNLVSKIISKNGFIWIATQHGITRIKKKQVQTYHLHELTENNNITAIAIDSQFLWLGIKDKGVLQIDLINNVPDLQNPILHVPTDHLNIRNIFIDSKGKLWMASKGYLGYYFNKKWTTLHIPNCTNNISDIGEDSKNHIWITTYNDGVYEYNLQSFKNYNKLFGIANNLVRSLFIDKNDNIWLSSKTGLTVLENGIPTIFNSENGLENENIKVVSQDNEGNIWLGTDGSGAFRFSGNEFVNFGDKNGLASVMSIIQDNDKTYWFSTYGEGITKYKDNVFTNYHSLNSNLTNNTIWTSMLDSKGQLWFGSSGGLIKQHQDEFKVYHNTYWLPSNKITSLFEDAENHLWIGTAKGVTEIFNNDTTIYTNYSGLETKNIRSITEYQNTIWLGTSNGVFTSNEQGFSQWENNELLGGKTVYCLKKWKDGIFIGTGNGLYYFDGKSLENIKLHSSFSANYINFITLESNQHLWVGTNFGIFEIDLSIYNFQGIKGINHHTTSDGLKSPETNLNAGFQDSEGFIWMGTGKALLRYTRKDFQAKEINLVPKIRIEDVQLFLKGTDWSAITDDIDSCSLLPNNLEVGHRKNYFTFFYKAISISRPEELRYKFRLNGFDTDWSPTITQQSFTYANLPYGDYTFEVIASIDGKNWSDSAKFSFIINKPYYLSWWFFLIASTAIFSIFYGVWRWRANISKQKRITEKLVYKSKLLALEQQSLNASMNRHFIFNALNSIQYYINTQDKLSANKYLTSFAKLIRKNLDSSSSGKSLVPLTDELERLELYITLEHMRFQNKFEYKIKIGQEVDIDTILIPPMFLQPFVENSIWHGILPMEKPGKIDIEIKRNQYNEITFIIEDNGIGVDYSLSQKNKHSHVPKGMDLTAGRLEILKEITNKNIKIVGPFQINDKSNRAYGTRVVITIDNNK